MNSICPPPISDWVMKAVIAAAKVNRQPATMPGRQSGRVTRTKVRHAPAPSAAEASARFGSIRDRAVTRGRTISGSCTCASARTRPPSV